MTVMKRLGKTLMDMSFKVSSNFRCVNHSMITYYCPSYNYSSGHRYLETHGARPQLITKEDKREFMALFPDIVRELTLEKRSAPEADLHKHMAKNLQYNVSGGKNTRGLSVVLSFRMLASDKDYTPENIRLAQVMGWCVEMLQGFFLVIDDITDNSSTRRGKPCWYKEVGYGAINDGIVLQNEAIFLIKKYLKGKECFLPILELFLETLRRSTFGQVLDCYAVNRVHELNMDYYNFIVRHKSSYYTFHLPVALGMYLAGIYNKELHRQAKNILLELGHYFQVQDDYIDVFGDEEITGKKGTDIPDGKITWVSLIAFQRATPSQRNSLMECFGKNDEESIKAVKDIYLDIGIPSLYHAYEEETYNLINRQIQQLSAGLPHELFLSLLHKIHGRKH